MRPSRLLAALVFLPLALGRAETVKDREGSVRADRQRMTHDARWIYNDTARGFAEAARAGKPVLVTLRCVPCLACKGMDEAVLESAELQPLLDRFVCVRIINANTLDLARFQFDYDLSFSTLFFHPDGAVLGRFGSWTHQRDPADSSLAGYRAALQAALDLHRGYPANKASLAAKQGEAPAFKTPLEIPALAGKYGRELDWEGKVVPSCVHCHQIGDALRAFHRGKGEPIPARMIYPMPAPETVGISLDPASIARVTLVDPAGPAARLGLRPGDEIVAAAGAPLVSAADLAWALHRAPDQGALALRVRRAGVVRDLSLELPAGWRSKSDISRRVGTWPMRAMALGGLKLDPVAADERKRLGLAPGTLALRAAHVGQYGAHAAAKNAGFQKNDILVSVEGIPGDLGEGELIGRILAAHPGKASLAATVLRGGRRVDLKLPVQ